MNTEPAVELEDVTVSYTRDQPILSKVSLRVNMGERLFIIGPNGGGKTTLLKTMVGVLRPDSGVVRLFGVAVQRFREWWRVGYVPQNAATLFERTPLSVGELLRSGMHTGKALDPVETLSLVGVDEPDKIIHRRVSDLSGGNLQKTMLALALINKPQLLILDEPTVYVDQTGVAALMNVINRVNRDWGVTVIIATHDVAAISTLASRVVCINRTALYDGDITHLLSSEELCRIYGFHVYTIQHGHRWSET
ncbi:MAG: metal ABC transporter ATP-binding protein [Candidatus Caldarchaeum sp.]|uniref:Metal ABC transporter ATP-binding protein n=1 Tax=Caldiarchaeum subterraneum TaxID=311458 RepID=A0A7J3WBB6_CALS0